ncbi:MAG: putative DNA-binding domain-containing protein [Burkholderiaceae bacterium]|nr:putative DNA-binding domain-containing protein [Burkholderiaceae bacterium]
MTAVSLHDFQQGFARALFAPAPAVDPSVGGTVRSLAAQPAFAVYRNTVMKGCIDALEANYPAVVQLVGRDWFRAAAALHVTQSPPRDPRLLRYGEAFAAFLRDFPAAASLPYLPAVAALDRAWTECHAAADAPVLDAAALTELAAMGPEAMGDLRLTPHPAARWHWAADMPVHSLWSRNRAALAADADLHDIVWQGEGSLLTRPFETVEWCALGAGGCALLDACAAGATLAEAAGAALDAEPACDLAGLLALLVGRGAFTGR